ncbi:phosphate transporter [Nematocida sp. AWRm78]|nr:phosphate transporter [Nematocida sp. AWRm79]KAI5182356.1 phosphate transporter [Nematocida sp. AWRm78]
MNSKANEGEFKITTTPSQHPFTIDITESSAQESPREQKRQRIKKAIKGKRENTIKAILGVILVIVGITIYFMLTNVYTSVFPSKSAAVCCIISFLASAFWSLHILPLEITSVALIPIVIISNIMVPDKTGVQGWLSGFVIVTKILVSPVVLLLMGSCLLSVYFQCNGGEKMVLPYLIDGGNIYSSLFRSMFLSIILSSIMSNITAPIIIISILQSRPRPPSPAIIMGVAMGSNIGGMVLPISSPQSILGSGIIGVSWSRWMWVSLPTVAVCFLFVFSLIIAYFPKQPQSENNIVIVGEPQNSSLLIIVTTLCIICWSLPSIYSGLKWIYALPVCALLITKSARKVFNRKTLEIISIAVAGTAIGRGIKTTKMLESMISGLIISSKERSLLFLLISLSFVMLCLSCIVCHTVSAVVLLPIYEKIGMFVGRPKLIVAISALACSCGMAFPASGFPNILASSFKSSNGKRLVSSKDFILIGTISTIVCWISILTVSLFFMVIAKF